jgi:hypothetical protein
MVFVAFPSTPQVYNRLGNVIPDGNGHFLSSMPCYEVNYTAKCTPTSFTTTSSFFSSEIFCNSIPYDNPNNNHGT